MTQTGPDLWTYFGDGNISAIISVKDIEADDGTKKVRFILKPTKRIINQYGIKEELEIPTNFIVREYPATEVVFLERGVDRIRCWVMTDFNGGPTKMTRRYADLKEVINDNDKIIRSVVAAKNRLFEELNEERTQKILSMKKLVDLVRLVGKARGRVDSEDMMGLGGADLGIPPEG